MINSKIIWGIVGIMGIGIGVRLALPAPPPQQEIRPLVKPARALEPTQPKIQIQLSGAIQTPGVYTVEKGTRVQEAIDLAGGLTPNADDRSINYVGKLRDGQHLKIPSIKAAKPKPQPTPSRKKTKTPVLRFDINRASAKEIAEHYSISKRGASQIVAYRSKMGWIRHTDELIPIVPTKDRDQLGATSK